MTRRHCLAALLAVTLTAACNAPVTPMPLRAAPPVIGHWLLDASTTGEHLWIEADGTFTEAGGSPFDVGTAGTLDEGATWAGSWTWADPRLTLDDAQTGPHAFGAVIQQFGARMILQSTRSFSFSRVTDDAGAD